MVRHLSDGIIQEHAENLLTGEDLLRAEKHLSVCRQCNDLVRLIRISRERVQSVPGISLTEGHATQISRMVRDRAGQEQEWSLIEKTAERILTGIAFVVILLVGISALMNEGQNGNGTYAAGILGEYITDTTVARLVNAETITKDEVLAAALIQD